MGVGGEVIETIVLGTNTGGLEFAREHGSVEADRHVADADEVWHTLRLVRALPPA
jgi:hypothetical protein